MRPDRPFEGLAYQQRQRKHQKVQNNEVSIPRWPTGPMLRPQYPTAYYLEQLRFFEGEDNPLPEEELADEEPIPSSQRGWLLAILFAVAQMLFEMVVMVLSAARRAWENAPKNHVWEIAASVLVATQIVRILPRAAGVVSSRGEWGAEQAPLYVIMVPNPKQFGRLFDDVEALKQCLTVSRKSRSDAMRHLVEMVQIFAAFGSDDCLQGVWVDSFAFA